MRTPVEQVNSIYLGYLLINLNNFLRLCHPDIKRLRLQIEIQFDLQPKETNRRLCNNHSMELSADDFVLETCCMFGEELNNFFL